MVTEAVMCPTSFRGVSRLCAFYAEPPPPPVRTTIQPFVGLKEKFGASDGDLSLPALLPCPLPLPCSSLTLPMPCPSLLSCPLASSPSLFPSCLLYPLSSVLSPRLAFSCPRYAPGLSVPDAVAALAGSGTSARFQYPSSMAYDAPNQELYVADMANHAIRKGPWGHCRVH